MLRSVCFSSILLLVIIYEFHSNDLPDIIALAIIFFLSNSISDYVSLFVIRRWLLMGGHKPVIAIFIGALIGMLVVSAAMSGVAIVFGMLSFYIINDPFFFLTSLWGAIFQDPFGEPLLLSAFAVHSWLILFGIGILSLRLLNLLRLSLARMQWFLKQGHFHPLDAIGYVAAVIVFFATVASRALFGST
jgi:hypothetical protein